MTTTTMMMMLAGPYSYQMKEKRQAKRKTDRIAQVDLEVEECKAGECLFLYLSDEEKKIIIDTSI